MVLIARDEIPDQVGNDNGEEIPGTSPRMTAARCEIPDQVGNDIETVGHDVITSPRMTARRE
ncbi:MAG: hypothetical protein J6Y02_09830, partial [Pseudobutyrivibrio sp.]|nr:hypothetical protein [Pseudobutyrivibrio sp.]